MKYISVKRYTLEHTCKSTLNILLTNHSQIYDVVSRWGSLEVHATSIPSLVGLLNRFQRQYRKFFILVEAKRQIPATEPLLVVPVTIFTVIETEMRETFVLKIHTIPYTYGAKGE